MSTDGRVNPIAFNEIQLISYVRDFNLDDPVDPERLGRRSFVSRPRAEGLWVRLGFQDDSSLEGLMPFDLGFLATVLDDQGIFLTPPEGRSNVLRVFVPRSALKSLEVLGWVSAPSKRSMNEIATSASKKVKLAATMADQPGLFEGSEDLFCGGPLPPRFFPKNRINKDLAVVPLDGKVTCKGSW
jgi:hypothetical protein